MSTPKKAGPREGGNGIKRRTLVSWDPYESTRSRNHEVRPPDITPDQSPSISFQSGQTPVRTGYPGVCTILNLIRFRSRNDLVYPSRVLLDSSEIQSE